MYFVCSVVCIWVILCSKKLAAVPLKCDDDSYFVGPDRVCQTFSWRRDLRYNCAYCTEEKKMRKKPFFCGYCRNDLAVKDLRIWICSCRVWSTPWILLVLTDFWLFHFKFMQNLSFSLCLSRKPTPDCLHARLYTNARTHKIVFLCIRSRLCSPKGLISGSADPDQVYCCLWIFLCIVCTSGLLGRWAVAMY